MAETPNVMHQLHMPLQSGSDAVLKSMRRSYRRDRYLGILERVRAAMPDAAITTDIIVGFPGETEADFQQTLDVVREARFSGAFTFLYSKRPGTPAADMPDQLPHEVVQERYERLVELVNEIAWSENQTFEGREVEVLVAEGEGRKDPATERPLGPRPRQPSGALHPPRLAPIVRPGDMVAATVTYAAPHHLVADGPPLGPPHPSRRRLGVARTVADRPTARLRLAGAADRSACPRYQSRDASGSQPDRSEERLPTVTSSCRRRLLAAASLRARFYCARATLFPQPAQLTGNRTSARRRPAPGPRAARDDRRPSIPGPPRSAASSSSPTRSTLAAFVFAKDDWTMAM